MTEPIASLPAAVTALGALPMPTGPARLTQEREAEIQTRDLLATKGPWGLYEEATGHQHIAAGLEETGHGYRCRRGIAQLDPEPIDNDPAHRDWTEAEDREQVRIDAEFITHAREDVPALLAELAAVRKERDEAQKRLHDAAMTRTWRNEDGKKFVFVEDIAPALLGLKPETEVAR
jgi:hypothetical protein